MKKYDCCVTQRFDPVAGFTQVTVSKNSSEFKRTFFHDDYSKDLKEMFILIGLWIEGVQKWA